MSKKIPALKPKTVLNILLRIDFYIHHQRGSHIQLHHRTKTNLRVTIPLHTNFDLPAQLILSILRQADLTRKEFLNLL